MTPSRNAFESAPADLEAARKHAEELNAVLREKEEDLRTTLASIGDGVITVDCDSRVVRLNLAGATLTGWSPAEAKGRSLDEVFHILSEETRETVSAPVARVLATGATEGLANHTILVARDGTERAVADSAAPIRNASGEVTGVVLVFRDVTEERRKQREREQLLEALAERIKEQTCLYSISQLAQEPEATLQGILSATPPVLCAGWKHSDSACARILYEGRTFAMENYAETPWKMSAPLTVNGVQAGMIDVCYLDEKPQEDEGPFTNAERELLQAVAERLSSAAGRMTALDRLQKNEERFRTYFEDSLIGMAITSPEKGWVKANDALCDLLGYSFEELSRTTWADLTHPDDLAADVEQFNRVLSGEIEGYCLSKRFISKAGGEIHTILSVKAVRRPDGTVEYILAQLQDVTLERRAQQAVEEEREKLLAILDGIEDVIYVADPETYELLHVNDAFRKVWGENVLGQKCYSVLQERDTACPFCTNDKIFGEYLGKNYVWEFQNEKNLRWFRCSDKAIPWVDGRMVRFETAADITELKAAQTALAEQEARFRLLVENVSDWMWEADAGGRFTYASPRTKDLLGYEPEEVLGKTRFDFMPPEEAQQIASAFGRVVYAAKPLSGLRNVAVHKDGRTIVLETSSAPFFDSKGQLQGYHGVDRDVTEREMAEAQIEALNRAMMGRELRMIELKEQVDGLCRDLGKTPLYEVDSIKDEDTGLLAPAGRGTEQSAAPQDAPLRDMHILFHVETLEKSLEIFCDVIGIAAAIIDLDGNVIAQARWKRICTKFHRVNEETCQRCIESDTSLANQLAAGEKTTVYHCLNGLADAASPILIDGKHVANAFVGQFLVAVPDEDVFRTQARKFGFDEEDYINALREVPVISEDRLPGILTLLTGLGDLSVAMGQERMETHRLTKSLQERQDELARRGRVALSLMQDAKQAEQRVREALARTDTLNQELKRSNEELEQFAYVASHDLQEPLRMVSSYTQLLADRYRDQLDEKARKFIHYAVDGAIRMQRLINDLLSYSRVTTRGGNMKNTDSHAALGIALSNLQKSIEESGALVSNGDLPRVRADESQLAQLFQNLIGNAVKFHGETLPRVHVEAEPDNRFWRFSVRDNGIGIDPQHRDRIFIIFQRLHSREQYEGTGIGLALCKRIVERHGGRIWIESTPGEGTTFYFTLPKTNEEKTDNA